MELSIWNTKNPKNSPGVPAGDSHRNVYTHTRWGSGQHSSLSGSEQGLKTVDSSATSMTESKRIELCISGINNTATLEDMQKLFQDIAGVTASEMPTSTDTGLNDSYCFVECETRDLAEKVMQRYHKYLWLGRAIEVAFADERDSITLPPTSLHGSRNRSSDKSWRRASLDLANATGNGLHVRHLPRFGNQAHAEANIGDLFKGFNIKTIGLLVSIRMPALNLLGNWNCCMVQLATPEEEVWARQALNNLPIWNSIIKVAANTFELYPKTLYVSGLPNTPNNQIVADYARKLLAGFQISRIIHTNRSRPPGDTRPRSCLVELNSEAEATAAAWKLDWTTHWGKVVRVKPAAGRPDLLITE